MNRMYKYTVLHVRTDLYSQSGGKMSIAERYFVICCCCCEYVRSVEKKSWYMLQRRVEESEDVRKVVKMSWYIQ